MRDNEEVHVGAAEKAKPSADHKRNIIITALVLVLAICAVGAFIQYQHNQQAKRDRTAAIERDNRNYNEYQQEINLLLIKNDYKGVISKADEYLQVGTGKKNIITMKSNKARAYKSLKDYPTALAIYKDAAKDADTIGDTTNYTIHHGLGIIYRELGQKEQAIQEYRKVIKGLQRNADANRIDIIQFEEEIRMIKAEDNE